MDESLWPARNVAEFAYCPRLFYLMEVEGIHLPSDDTESGHRVHRRVDAPSAEQTLDAAESGERPASVRSLTLTSQSLGLTATLDLAEISGQTAVPIEYRKGRPRRVFDSTTLEPWPTDRIQVALQSLLLEEAGYSVTQCVIYYAAEKRRLTIPFDEPLRAEALATLDAARAAATQPRPLPLVNDPRCARCSLQPICLPDEVNFERHVATGVSPVESVATSLPTDDSCRERPLWRSENGDSPSAAKDSPLRPRSLWPPRDDGIHLVAQQNGSKVGVSGASLAVTDKDGKKLGEFPLANVESLSLLGSVQISTQAVGTLADRGIPIAYLSAAVHSCVSIE